MKLKLKFYLDKLLAALRVRALVGGMEVSDTALRFAYFDGETWRMSGVRLEPGVIEAGKIKSYDKLVAALSALKNKAFSSKESKKRVNVIVSLGSISIYSQVFSLPMIKGQNLDKAIQLNVQMVSPVEASKAYSGWQLVGEDQKSLRLEILSAFIDRSTVDEVSRALFDAGFLVVAMESRALAVTRVFREEGEGVDMRKPYILVSLDGSGLDFLIIRQGQLYFEYFNPWRDIVDEKGKVSMPTFEAAVTRSLHQVMNFYGQHWPDPIDNVIISATSFTEEISKIVKENFAMQAKELKLRTRQPIGAEWFIAFGCGLRGLKPRDKDKEMSLLGIGAEEEFRREQLVYFAEFWRLLMPAFLSLLIILFLLGDLFLIQTRRSLESQTLFSLSNEQAKENQSLQTQALEFNRLVSMVGSVQSSYMRKSEFMEKIQELASSNGVALSRFSFSSPDKPISINGRAESEDRIVAFKKALETDPGLQGVNLPLTGIQSGPEGLSFSVTLSLKQ